MMYVTTGIHTSTFIHTFIHGGVKNEEKNKTVDCDY